MDLLNKEPQQLLIFPNMLPLHKQLRLKRYAEDFTQVQLAKMLGMGESTLCDVEAGKRRIPYKCLDRVKSYLYEEFYMDGQLQRINKEGGQEND